MPRDKDLPKKYDIPRERYRELTAKRAESREREKKDVALIERCVKLACGSDVGLITPLLKNVTQGTPYEYMPVPSGRRQFYNLRHKFFCILDREQK